MNRIATLALVFAIACAPEAADVDLANDTSFARAEGNVDDILLDVANYIDQDTLDFDAALDARAARNIVETRSGADGIDGTADDVYFATVADLDAVPYVGPSALDKLLDWADDNSVHGVVEGTPKAAEILFTANTRHFTTLDIDVDLDRRAAENIRNTQWIDGQYQSLADLDATPYVGPSAFGKLAAWADSQSFIDVEACIDDGLPNRIIALEDYQAGTSIKSADDFYLIDVAAGQTIIIDLDFSHASADLDLRLTENGSVTFLGQSTGIIDGETLTWTNEGESDVQVDLEVYTYWGSTRSCADYELFLSIGE